METTKEKTAKTIEAVYIYIYIYIFVFLQKNCWTAWRENCNLNNIYAIINRLLTIEKMYKLVYAKMAFNAVFT